MKAIEQLAFVPLFSGLPKPQCEDLATILVKKTFGKGESIFSQGSEGIGFYVVLTGKVKIFKLSMEGKEQILQIFGPGDPFGEVPVFAGERFPAFAEAIEKSDVFFFPREAFVGLIQNTPSLALNMLAELSCRLRKLTTLIEDLSLKEVPGRLSAYLLYLSERMGGANELELDISKGQLASLLGTIPETLSRILNRLSKEGIIQSKGPRRIHILNRGRIKDLASGLEKI